MINSILLDTVDALAWAAECHAGQYRGDGVTPYIKHPIEVVQILVAAGIDNPDLLAAAALHDVVEDCGVTYAQIEDRFGVSVAYLVNQLTKDSTLSKFPRRVNYVSRLSRAGAGVQTIKIADMISNVRDMKNSGWDLDRKEEYLEYLDAMYAVIDKVPEILDLKYSRLRFKAEQDLDNDSITNAS
jgi:guanosine-3',5'-bis(diphosphate) 3'-pyrophosphohydrolase